MRIVQVNAAYDARIASPSDLLGQYATLVGWGDAVRAAGASVQVVQRFARDDRIAIGGISYELVADRAPATPSPRARLSAVVERVRAVEPDLVHVNGLGFPQLLMDLRTGLPPATAIVVQDHAGVAPPSQPWPIVAWQRRLWRRGFEAVDACSFTSTEQAVPWVDGGMLAPSMVIEVVEASTTLRPMPRDDARRATGISGDPAILWIGRFDRDKDPMTALTALERFLPAVPDAAVWMISRGGWLDATVRIRIANSQTLRGRVTLVGAVPHEQVAAWLSAADVFLSASHREGSGYALIEAMACGAWPAVTDIPSFRAIVGGTGARWRPGDADACANVLLTAVGTDREAARADVRRRFDEALTWPAIGARTCELYRSIVHTRRTRTSS